MSVVRVVRVLRISSPLDGRVLLQSGPVCHGVIIQVSAVISTSQSPLIPRFIFSTRKVLVLFKLDFFIFVHAPISCFKVRDSHHIRWDCLDPLTRDICSVNNVHADSYGTNRVLITVGCPRSLDWLQVIDIRYLSLSSIKILTDGSIRISEMRGLANSARSDERELSVCIFLGYFIWTPITRELTISRVFLDRLKWSNLGLSELGTDRTHVYILPKGYAILSGRANKKY